MVDISSLNEDERRLAELGYKQELNRSWSGFHNFAISFSIISILAGCFTSFGLAWNAGGPMAISWGWPIIGLLILLVGVSMSELVSAYPTSAGIYWWASKLGGPAAGFYTGWLNLIGLLGILASVAYASASFLNITIGLFSPSYATGFLNGNTLYQQFFWFIIVVIAVTVVNLFKTSILGIINTLSVWWHVIGASAVVLILIFGVKHHASLSFVFTQRLNYTGFFNGETTGFGFWLFVLPLSFILTQYTITGYDASAHLSEETRGAADGAAKGIWRSILYSVIGGWILLLAFLFAVQSPDAVNKAAVDGFAVTGIFATALSAGLFKIVMLISTIGQLYCTTSCLTSCSRMMFAFSRDGAVPGGRLWSRVNSQRVPVNAVVVSSIIAVLITLPALKSFGGFPIAFFAVVTIGVIGLYVAFAIPIFLRWRAGDSWEPGGWTLGRHYKWIAPIAVLEIAVTSVIALMPTLEQGVPWASDFTWSAVNYTPIVVGAVLLVITIWWFTSAKNWFKGPKTTIDLPEGVSAADELAAEAHGQDLHRHSEGTPPA
ncbi:MAG: amino acid permease [Actinomycetes bacterium]